MITHQHPQGTAEWLESRRGVVTASRAKDARDFKRNGGSSEKRTAYAMDLARERVGGKAPAVFVNAAMRTGTEEEQFAAIEYVARTGRSIEEAYFITTDDGKFGVSLDRWVGDKAALEIKTMVSSVTLFKAVVDGDISDYMDQCLFAIWLLSLEWVDLCLWAPDLPQPLHVVRIHRDEEQVQKLEDDMLTFDKLVNHYQARLHSKLVAPTLTQVEVSTPPWSEPVTPKAAEPKRTPAPIPESIF